MIEKEMRESSEEWVFPIYSVYNDDTYDKYLIQIDEDRIRVINKAQHYKITFESNENFRMATLTLVPIFARSLDASLKTRI